MELIANYRVLHLSIPALYCPILCSFTCQSLHGAHTHTHTRRWWTCSP